MDNVPPTEPAPNPPASPVVLQFYAESSRPPATEPAVEQGKPAAQPGVWKPLPTRPEWRRLRKD